MAIAPAPHLTARAKVFEAFVLKPMEDITYGLRKGRAMNDEDEKLAWEVVRRAEAMRDALEARTPVVEDDE